jgi:hypothetical protein
MNFDFMGNPVVNQQPQQNQQINPYAQQTQNFQQQQSYLNNPAALSSNPSIFQNDKREGDPFGSMRKIEYKVTNCLLVPTGQYKDIYIRPVNVELNTRQLQTVEETIKRKLQMNDLKMEAVDMLGASDILKPGEAIRKAEIIGGWQQERFIFLLTIEYLDPYLNTWVVLYLTGFTDFPNANPNTGTVDDNMLLIPNTVIQLVRVQTETGPRLKPMSIYSIEYFPQQGTYTIHEEQIERDLFVLKPQDAIEFINNINIGLDSVPMSADVNKVANVVNRNHLIPTYHITETINALTNGFLLTDNYMDTEKTLNIASATKTTISSIPFFMDLERKFGRNANFAFPIGYLKQLDPSFQPVILNTDPSLQNISIPGILTTTDTEDTASSILEAKISVLARDAVSTLIAKYMLLEIGFSFTNTGPGGQFIFTPYMARGVVPNVDTAFLVERFRIEFENLVVPSLTFNNQVAIKIDVIASVVGDTRIAVSVNNGPEVPFRYPTFADSLYNSLIMDFDRFTHNARMFKDLIDTAILSIEDELENNNTNPIIY